MLKLYERLFYKDSHVEGWKYFFKLDTYKEYFCLPFESMVNTFIYLLQSFIWFLTNNWITLIIQIFPFSVYILYTECILRKLKNEEFELSKLIKEMQLKCKIIEAKLKSDESDTTISFARYRNKYLEGGGSVQDSLNKRMKTSSSSYLKNYSHFLQANSESKMSALADEEKLSQDSQRSICVPKQNQIPFQISDDDVDILVLPKKNDYMKENFAKLADLMSTVVGDFKLISKVKDENGNSISSFNDHKSFMIQYMKDLAMQKLPQIKPSLISVSKGKSSTQFIKVKTPVLSLKDKSTVFHSPTKREQRTTFGHHQRGSFRKPVMTAPPRLVHKLKTPQITAEAKYLEKMRHPRVLPLKDERRRQQLEAKAREIRERKAKLAELEIQRKRETLEKRKTEIANARAKNKKALKPKKKSTKKLHFKRNIQLKRSTVTVNSFVYRPLNKTKSDSVLSIVDSAQLQEFIKASSFTEVLKITGPIYKNQIKVNRILSRMSNLEPHDQGVAGAPEPVKVNNNQLIDLPNKEYAAMSEPNISEYANEPNQLRYFDAKKSSCLHNTPIKSKQFNSNINKSTKEDCILVNTVQREKVPKVNIVKRQSLGFTRHKNKPDAIDATKANALVKMDSITSPEQSFVTCLDNYLLTKDKINLTPNLYGSSLHIKSNVKKIKQDRGKTIQRQKDFLQPKLNKSSRLRSLHTQSIMNPGSLPSSPRGHQSSNNLHKTKSHSEPTSPRQTPLRKNE